MSSEYNNLYSITFLGLPGNNCISNFQQNGQCVKPLTFKRILNF